MTYKEGGEHQINKAGACARLGPQRMVKEDVPTHGARTKGKD